MLVLIEGLSANHVQHSYTPEIRGLESKGIVVCRFVTHQRQTNRDLFAVLCGAYPNLMSSETRPHLMALSPGSRQHCLPEALRASGMRTAFLGASRPSLHVEGSVRQGRPGLKCSRGCRI